MSSNSDSYFKSYEDLEVHELMLKDRPRQEAYHEAIMANKDLFKGKVVLDVGAGTGILSIFCAKAGARTVYAVEASDLAKLAIEVVEENNLTSIVKVFQTQVEDFELPTDEICVDIIVSEWMGFYLLHEGMLDSVLKARDKFLAPDGIMFPRAATLLIAPCSVPSQFEYWESVDGVSMKQFAKHLRRSKAQKPEIMIVDKEQLLATGEALTWLDLKEISVDDLEEICRKELVTIQKTGRLQGFCLWFTCGFPGGPHRNSIELSTSPFSPPTHWKQCVIVLPEELCHDVEPGEPVAFKISIKRNSVSCRRYNIELLVTDPEEVEHPMPCDCYMTKCILAKAHLERMESIL